LQEWDNAGFLCGGILEGEGIVIVHDYGCYLLSPDVEHGGVDYIG